MKEAGAAARQADLLRLVKMYEALAPESAAPLIRDMVGAGNLGDAAEILALMKDRAAARLIDAVGDRPTMAQLAARVREIKARQAFAPAPRLVM